jgi:hypothetical protein
MIRSIKTSASNIGMLAAIALLAVVVSVCAGGNAWAQCAGSNVTIQNKNSYPIWLGEGVQGTSNIVLPDSSDWQIPANGQATFCLPTNWISGVFWPRTECNFAGTFGKDPDYKSCTSSSDCTLQHTTDPAHICYGGECVIDCSTATGTNGSCSSLSNSVCVAAAGSAAPNYTAGSFCGFSGGVCKTGDCGSGLYQCEGQWDSLTAQFGPAPPVSLFEITDKNGAPNYDVSHVSGYNVSVVVTPPATQAGGSCQPSGCVSDLNTSCPAALQVTEPVATAGPIACGTGFCQSGTCVNGNTCVIGCNDPADQCTASNPASLHCQEPIPSPLPSAAFPSNAATPHPTPDGATYLDMYLAKNSTGLADPSDKGDSMFSANQGTPTCWGNLDCLPGETCMIGSASGITGFPSNLGICVGASGYVNGQTDCYTTSDIGNDCGGYPNAGVYSCVASSITTGGEKGVACVPSFNPPIIGLGGFDSTDSLFDGVGAPLNPEWEAAAIVAGGGTTPYYEAFTNACPNQYAWVYDDHAGGFSCASFPADFTVAFGALSGSGSPTPTATPTPSATATATATSTSSVTPTATATASATATATATATVTTTATATATATATSGTPTPTATVTPTVTPTRTATATQTPTPTPTPSGTPTPVCLNGFLSTNPPGTLVFANVNAGKSSTLPLQVTNGEPAGALKLSDKISGVNAGDFSVTGGNCKTINRLQAGQTCTYEVKLKAKKKSAGGVAATLNIKGSFKPGICSGKVQSQTVTLAGFVVAP